MNSTFLLNHKRQTRIWSRRAAHRLCPVVCDSRGAAKKNLHTLKQQQQHGDRLFNRIYCAMLRLTTLQAVTNRWRSECRRFLYSGHCASLVVFQRRQYKNSMLVSVFTFNLTLKCENWPFTSPPAVPGLKPVQGCFLLVQIEKVSRWHPDRNT